MRIEERDYSFLRGTECKMESIDGKTIECIVPNIDYFKGISIVNIDDSNSELCCLNAKVHKLYNYKGVFCSIVRKIQKNEVIPHRFFDKVYFGANDSFNYSVSQAECAYK